MAKINSENKDIDLNNIDEMTGAMYFVIRKTEGSNASITRQLNNINYGALI